MFRAILPTGYRCVPIERRRYIGGRRIFGSEDNNRLLEMLAGEQSQKHGVYIGVFEQSILIHDRPTKARNFFASLSAELVALTLAILIPLVEADHLPAFHWKTISVSAPVKPLDQVRVERTSAGPTAGPVLSHRIFVLSTVQTSFLNQSDSGELSIDPPGSVGLGEPSRPGDLELERFIAMPATVRPPHQPATTPTPAAPIRVGGDVQMAKLVKKVIPVYPPLAKNARISGVVHLLGVIAKDGTIQNLQLISGHPLLAHAAIEAVRQWVYQPTLLNGEPVEVTAPIDIKFTLGP